MKLLAEAVVGDSALEYLTLAAILVSIAGWYKTTRCHDTTCRNKLGLRRHGKYPHKHYKLCAVHHPHVPNDDKVTSEHTNA